MRAFAVAAALVIGAVIATSLAVQTLRSELPAFRAGAKGTLHSVLLTNNQLYYGILDRIDAHSVKLTQVFYVQVTTDPTSGAHTNKLVDRTAKDWHAPVSMTIPIDKIIFVEVVGANSAVAKLIAEAIGHR